MARKLRQHEESGFGNPPPIEVNLRARGCRARTLPKPHQVSERGKNDDLDALFSDWGVNVASKEWDW